MKILVGSKNPVKIAATKEAFEKYFEDVEVLGYEIDSGVPAQPVREETFRGARNRAVNLKKMNDEKNCGAEFFVGIEGGISDAYGRWFSFGAICIIDKNGNEAFGTSPQFELPSFVIEKLLEGEELGTVMDEIQNTENTKQKHGAIGFFTKGKMERKELYVAGLTVAIAPFLHRELFFEE